MDYYKTRSRGLATQRLTQQDLLDSLQDDHACFQKLINRLNEEEQ